MIILLIALSRQNGRNGGKVNNEEIARFKNLKLRPWEAMTDDVVFLCEMLDAKDVELMLSQGETNGLEFKVKELEARIAAMREFLENVAENYDCDMDAHKYSSGCRSCDAKKMLSALPAQAPQAQCDCSSYHGPAADCRCKCHGAQAPKGEK